MFLGSRVDDAVSLYYRRLADEQLDLEQVKDAYRDLWQSGLEAEQDKLGVNWTDIHQQAAFEIGLDALELTFTSWCHGSASRSQCNERWSSRSSASLEWTILCYLDLETRGRAMTGEEIERVVDYKVKGSTISEPRPTATRKPACT